MRIMIVGGTFDNNEGKFSYTVWQMANIIGKVHEGLHIINGGNLKVLDNLIDNGNLINVGALIWLPNVDNEEDKLLPKIKERYPHLVLVQSKRVIEKEYSTMDLIKRMLDSHSALMIKVTKDDFYKFSIIDPLGNEWCGAEGVKKATEVLYERIKYIACLSRVRSKNIGEKEYFRLEDGFLYLVHKTGEKFSELINAANPDRFLGNASTRCSHGFPSARGDDGTSIYVSKRNVDKRIINSNQFVEVKINNFNSDVEYYGNDKPSVDTPIQVLLYEYYTNVEYMIHGHVYAENAKFTEHNVPCGFLEEFDEIIELYPDPKTTDVVINLKGHGCLIMASSISFLDSVEYVKRDILEKA
ncbi:MAG: class II aldolase/adducin family protein [Gammaproteobacteria bacterium]|nr:class II aldolase/adducin family protein [Gammaproteobacteria bacterium]